MSANVDMHQQRNREAIARMAGLLSPATFAMNAPDTFAAWARETLADADACVRQLRALADMREIDGDAVAPLRPLVDDDRAWLACLASREAAAEADEATFKTLFADARLLYALARTLHPNATDALTRAAALPTAVVNSIAPTPAAPAAPRDRNGPAAPTPSRSAAVDRMRVVPPVDERATAPTAHRFSIATLLVGAVAGFLFALVLLLPLMLGGSSGPSGDDAWALDPAVAARLQQPEGQALLAKLRGGLASDDVGVRTMAAFHLARLQQGLDEVVPVLVDALDRPEIQPIAQRGLFAFGPAAVPVMLSTVAQPDYDQRPAVRDNIVLVLETMGAPAVEAAEQTANAPAVSKETRGVARQVLSSIRREIVAQAGGSGCTLRIEEMEELIVDVDENGVQFRRVYSATATATGENASANIAIDGENFSVRANATASNGTATTNVTTSNNGRSVRVEQHSQSNGSANGNSESRSGDDD